MVIIIGVNFRPIKDNFQNSACVKRNLTGLVLCTGTKCRTLIDLGVSDFQSCTIP